MNEFESARDADTLIYMNRITADNGVTDRAVRKWIAKQIFPPPEGNLNGRNFWTLRTYRVWQAAVRAGKFSRKAARRTQPGLL